MDNNVKHLKMVDVYSLRRQLQQHLGEMRNREWSEITFSVKYITGLEVIVEYYVEPKTAYNKVKVWGDKIDTMEVIVHGANAADKLPAVAMGLIASSINPQYLLVDDTEVMETIYDDHYPCPVIHTEDINGK